MGFIRCAITTATICCVGWNIARAQKATLLRLIHRYHMAEALDPSFEAAEDVAIETRAAGNNPDLILEYDYWRLRGDANLLVIRRSRDIEARIGNRQALEDAAASYIKAWQLAIIPQEKKYLLESMKSLASHLLQGTGMLLNYDIPETAHRLARYLNRMDSIWRVECGRSILSHDELIEHRYLLGITEYLTDHTDRAIPILEELAAINYPDPMLYVVLGQVYRHNNPLQLGQILRQGRDLFPYHPQLLRAAVEYYMAHRNYDSAYQVLQGNIQTSTIDPIGIHQMLGDLFLTWYKETGDPHLFDSAHQYYQWVIARVPDHYNAHYGLSELFYYRSSIAYQSKDPTWYQWAEKATRHSLCIERHNPNEQRILEILAQVYRWQGKEEYVQEIKKRIAVLEAGGVLKTSLATQK